jgi:hypothetical protein
MEVGSKLRLLPQEILLRNFSVALVKLRVETPWLRLLEASDKLRDPLTPV